MSPIQIAQKLTHEEHKRLVMKCMILYNQPFEVIEIDTRGKKKQVLIRLHSGVPRSVVI